MPHTDPAILDACRRLILAHGYTSLELHEVATEAGLPLAAITRRFPTKRDLLRGLLLPLHEALGAILMAHPIRLTPRVEDQRTLIENVVRVSLEHRAAYALTLRIADDDVDLLLGPHSTRDLFHAGGIRLLGPDYGTDPSKRTRVLAALGAIAHLMGSRLQPPLDTPEEQQALVDGLLALLNG